MGGKVERARLYRNTVSYFGGLIVIIAVGLTLLLFVINISVAKPSPYIGILTYMIAPGFITAGHSPVSVRDAQGEQDGDAGWGRGGPPIRGSTLTTAPAQALHRCPGGGSFLAFLLCFLGYRAYLFTDSTTFCGVLCHRVMKPEYTAYRNGPHARVACVNCHVGSGVPWYVKSKISGAPQVFSTIFNTYVRPIPVPIKNLRPAREICEECHWPEKFYGAQLMQNPHFRYDEKNTPEQVSLLLRTGGGTPNLGGERRHPLAHDYRHESLFQGGGPPATADTMDQGRAGRRVGRGLQGFAATGGFGEDRQAARPSHGLHGLPQPALPRLCPA